MIRIVKDDRNAFSRQHTKSAAHGLNHHPCARKRRLLAFGILLIALVGFLGANAQQASLSITDIESLIRSQHYDEALQALDAGLQKAPTSYRLLTLKGIVLSKQGKNQDALAAFEKAVRLSPTYIPAVKGEVQLLFQASDKRAIPLLERLLKSDPDDTTAHEMLALFQKKQGNCNAAIDHFALAAEAVKTHPESLEAYGYCLVELKQFEKAVPVFEQLVALLPERAYPKYDLAVVLIAAKQNEAAIKALEPLLTDDQKDPDILSLASQAYEAVVNTPKAVSLLRQAIVLSPSTASYYVSFAEICLSHDSFQVGIDMINAGLQRIPNDPSLYLSRGILYAQLAQYDKAEADFNRAEKLDSAQSVSSYALDLTNLQRNKPDVALVKVRAQLQAHPNDALFNFLLGQLLMDQAPDPGTPAFNEALKSALLAVKLKPDHVGARNLLASIYMHSGQYDLAIEQCRIALKYAPSDETATYHLVISLRHLGKSEELPALVKRLSQLHKESLQAETDRKRYRLVEEAPPSSQDTNAAP
jgi:tetratricopeptide (TPR) repeat protein